MTPTNLSRQEKTVFMLAAYVYGNRHLDYHDFLMLATQFMSQSSARTTIASLEKKKLLEPQTHYYFCYDNWIATGKLFKGLSMLLSEENEEEYRNIKNIVRKKTKTPVAPANAYAIALLSKDSLYTLPSMSECDAQFIYELSRVVAEREYHDVALGLSDHLFWFAIDCILDEAIANDLCVDWEYLRHLVFEERNKTSVTPVVTEDTRTAFNMYYYLGTGKTCYDIETARANKYNLITAAIQHLYQGKAPAAYKLFAKAMTMSNKTAANKGLFDCSVANYYYVMAQLLCGDEAAQKKLDTIMKKYASKNLPCQLFLMPLHSFFRLHKDVGKARPGTASTEGMWALHWLAWMILKRLDALQKDEYKDLTLTNHPPHAAFLRAELQPTGIIPASDDSAKAYGSPVFYQIKMKTMWEMRLEEIINENSAETTANPAGQGGDTRLIYLLDNSIITPVVQKRLKNGNWSVGKRLTNSMFTRLTDSDAPLDKIDQTLMRNIDSWDYNIYANSYLPYLAGCDHVYTGGTSDLIPVSIHEDKPFLIINRGKNGSFSVTTNVDELAKPNSTKQMMWKQNSDTDYSVYCPTATERRIYSQLLAQNKYPKEAEPLLMKVIATLGGKTEIHSNMMVDLDDMDNAEGDSRITVRCMPDRYDTYNLSFSVHAFPGLVFVPGDGNTTTIAEKDGKKVQVMRHLRIERRNLKQVAMKLADMGAIDDADDLRPQTITESVAIGLGMFLEFMQWTKDNSGVCELEWPEGAKIKYHPAVKASSAKIGFKAKNGWFDVEGDVQVSDDQVVSLQKLLELMHAAGKQRYIKVGENEYITLSSDLSKILKRLDTVTTEHRSHLQMSPAAVGLIGDILDKSDADITHSKAMDDLRQRIAESAKVQPQVPKGLNATMRDYQEEGYEWMERVTSWGAGACLADDMGLGKTLQTIAMLLDKQSEGASLVVAPASVVPNWRNELKRFAPALRVTMLNDAGDRAEAIKSAAEGDIIVSTYALLNIQQEQLAEKEWNIVCLDEAHTIKNPGTKMSKAAMTLQAKRKVILTGTPIQNHLAELWNLFQFINPGLLGSAEQFAKKFIDPIEGRQDKERQSQLRRLISPFLLRRTKGEVIDELPEKNEIVIPVELSPDETAMYEVRRRQAEKAVLADKNVKVSTLAEITRLRQMACSVSLVDKKWKIQSSKVAAFIDLAESLNDSGNRALVFSQFTSFFDQVRTAMNKAKLTYLYLDGSTPLAQREKLVKEFQSGSCPFFLISLKAGGLGLNLTGANYVIHLDPWWNPAIEQQATDRAYRIGQKQDVTVYHLISQHTIEEKIRRLHKTKRDLADSLLEGTDMSHALTQEELLELLQ